MTGAEIRRTLAEVEAQPVTQQTIEQAAKLRAALELRDAGISRRRSGGKGPILVKPIPPVEILTRGGPARRDTDESAEQ